MKGDIDPKCLTDTGQADAIERHSGFVAEASHSDGIVSFVMRDETPLIWPVFQRAMETLIALRGPDLLRIKGLLNLAGSKGPVVFQAVQHLIHPPVELVGLAGQGSRQPRGVHHARRERAAGRGLVQGVPGARDSSRKRDTLAVSLTGFY